MFIVKKDIINEVKSILKNFKVRYRISNSSERCYCYPSRSYVFIGLKGFSNLNRNIILSAVFHEIAHILNYKNKKYYRYNNEAIRAKRNYQYIIKFGLKAEQHTDYIASKLMKKYNPKLKYYFAYSDPEVKERYREEFLSLFK